MTSEDRAMSQDLNSRVDELEAFVAHQDGVIRDLNDMVTQQWDKIDILTRKVERLHEQLRSVEDNMQVGAPPEPPPPHY